VNTEKLDKPTVIPKVEKKTASKIEKRKRTKTGKKKPKKSHRMISTGETGTQQGKEKTLPEIAETQEKKHTQKRLQKMKGKNSRKIHPLKHWKKK